MEGLVCHTRARALVMTRADQAALLQLAARQYSLVALNQARALGYTRSALEHCIRTGRWERSGPRVIALVGRRPDWREPLMAATLDGGPGTTVSRRSAAALWRLPGYPFGMVEVARMKGVTSRRPPKGRLYTVRYLPDHLITQVDGIDVISLPYLLFQLAGFERPARVERLLNTVVTRSPAVLVRLHQLLPELAEHGRNGIVFMREWLDRNPPGSRVVASGLEGRFQRILIESGERRLDRQVDVGGHEWIGRVDFADLEVAALFEVDSQTHHASELDMALDAARDAKLLQAG